MEGTWLIIKLVVSLGVVLFLMYITFRFAGNEMGRINKDKYIKVIDRTQVSKDASLLIVKIGEKGYVMSLSNGKMEKLEEVTKDEILKIEKMKEKKIEEFSKPYEKIEVKLKKFFREKIKVKGRE